MSWFRRRPPADFFALLHQAMDAANIPPLTDDQVIPLAVQHSQLERLDLSTLPDDQASAVRAYMNSLRSIVTVTVTQNHPKEPTQ